MGKDKYSRTLQSPVEKIRISKTMNLFKCMRNSNFLIATINTYRIFQITLLCTTVFHAHTKATVNAVFAINYFSFHISSFRYDISSVEFHGHIHIRPSDAQRASKTIIEVAYGKSDILFQSDYIIYVGKAASIIPNRIFIIHAQLMQDYISQ